MTVSVIPPAPTYADVVLVDKDTNKGKFNPIWLKWFLDLSTQVNVSATVTAGTVTDASGALTQYYVVIGNGGNDLKTMTDVPAANQVLTSHVGAAPTWEDPSFSSVLAGQIFGS